MVTRKKKININLVTKKKRAVSYGEQFIQWALSYGRYIIIITQIFVLSVFFLRFKLDRDHTDLKEAVTQKQAIVESVVELEDEVKHVQKKLADIRVILNDQDIPIKVVKYFQQNVPSDTQFSSLSITQSSVSFGATSGNLRSFNYLLKKLLNGNKFNEVSLASISRRGDGRIEYKMNAKLNIKNFD